jgi:predicted ester cyclase
MKEQGMPDSCERNKDVIRRLLAEVDRGNLDVVDTYYSPGYVDHTPSPIRGLANGRDGVRKAFALFQEAFPDTRHTIEDLVAEGDRVVARISARGTHTGELFGHAPTGRVVTLTAIAIYRIVAGQIVERWAEQGLGVLDQLGFPAPRPTSGAATPFQAESSR